MTRWIYRNGRSVPFDPDNPPDDRDLAPRKPRVYIAAPYTQGDNFENVRAAIDAADRLYEFGFSPFVPHLFAFWNMIHPRPGSDWMRLDLVWLAQCQAVLRIPGESEGADREIAEAEGLGLPVFSSIEALCQWVEQSDPIPDDPIPGSTSASGDGSGNGADELSSFALDHGMDTMPAGAF